MGGYYSIDLRKKVISYISRRGSKKEAAIVFAIVSDTVYCWIRSNKRGQLGSKKRTDYIRKVSDNVIIDYISKYQDHTLKEIELAVCLHSSKVWKYLKHLNITLKKSTLYKERDEAQRSEFREIISSIDPSTIVYIDESGVDNRIFRAYARAKRGEQVYADVNGVRKRRYSMIGGLMNSTFIAPIHL